MGWVLDWVVLIISTSPSVSLLGCHRYSASWYIYIAYFWLRSATHAHDCPVKCTLLYNCLTNSINLPWKGKTLKKNHYFGFKTHVVPVIPFTFRLQKLQKVFTTDPVSHGRDN